MRRSQTGYFLELGGKMCYTAIVHLVGDFGESKLIVDQQFFYPLDFLRNKEFLYCNSLYFRKKISKIGVIVI